MKIYTKGGDEGLTSLSDGSRTRKDDSRIEVCGTLDELNAHIGLLNSLLLHNDGTQLSDDFKNEHTLFLEQLQETLFSVGALVVSGKDSSLQHPVIVRNTMELETLIDRMDAELAPLLHFILPGGVQAAAQCHVCRTVCRRAERRMVALSAHYDALEMVLPFMNRLSDYFFVLSRYLNIHGGDGEKTWGNTCR